MNVPFQITLPKIEITNDRDIRLSFSTLVKVGEPRVTTVIDYWEITDNKGRRVKDTPTGDACYIKASQFGKKINLVMKGAGFQISYDCLDICIHFLTQDGKSIAAHYKYENIGSKLSLSFVDVRKMTDDEESAMLDILAREAKAASNNQTSIESRCADTIGSAADENHYAMGELADFSKAVEQEMTFLKNSGGKHYKITNGQFIMQSQGGFVYSFDLDAELFIAEDSPVNVHVGLDTIAGTVLLCENFQIIIALEKIPYADKSLKIPKAEISAEPWKLLEKLNVRLRSINESHTIARKLLSEGPTLASSESLSAIVRGQKAAIQHAIDSPITVIWGPPGTGKTYTMAKMAQYFLEHGKKILIVSHSNVSVDNVAKQIYSQIKDGELAHLLSRSKILRYGYVRDEELQKNEFVTSFKVAIRNSQDKEKFEKLQAEYKRLTLEAEVSTDTEIHQEILRINQEIKAIKAKYKET